MMPTYSLRPKLLTLYVAIFVFLGVVLSAFFFRDGAFYYLKRRPAEKYPFEKEIYENIVQKISKNDLGGENTKFFKVDLSSKTGEIQEASQSADRGQARGEIFARRNKEGKLSVLIVTNDLGHDGMFGFMFSQEISGSTLGAYFPFSGWALQEDLGDSWWRVINLMD
jgi:hypothetical protein